MNKFTIWNKKDSINGISAEEVLHNNPMFQDETIILIYDENDVITNMEMLRILKQLTACDSDDVDVIMTKYFEFMNNTNPVDIDLKAKCDALEAQNQELLLALYKLVESNKITTADYENLTGVQYIK